MHATTRRLARHILIAWMLLALALPGAAEAAPGAAVPWPDVTLTEVAGGFTNPVHVTHAGDGSGRVFVVEKPGRIRIVKDGVTLPTPFLDIEARVLLGSERGLLSVAFPDGYATAGRFYVNYTRRPDGATVIARFAVTVNPDVADPASEQIVLVVPQPYANHNGGQIAFGPDGYLYIGMGDGGSGGDPQNHAQNPASLLGKLLRVDVEAGDPLTYTVPADNPFVGVAGYRPEIWSTGLRNPWRFAFDDATGDVYIADVGQGTWEEVSVQPGNSTGGENYGWRILEGAHCFNPSSGCTPPAAYVAPAAEYSHSLGCSVSGGHVYLGIYYYADYCSGRLWGLQHDGSQWLSQPLDDWTFPIATFGLDEAGRFYVADYGDGILYRVEASHGASRRMLAPGWHLLSFPLVPDDLDVAAVLASVAGKYDRVFAYDAANPAAPWSLHEPGGTENTLAQLDVSRGFWLHITEAALLSIPGTVTPAPAIALAAGWNLVGYPGHIAQPITEALAGIAGQYDVVYAFDPNAAGQPWQIYRPGATQNTLTVMQPGLGYWIRATQDTVWTLPAD